MITFEEMKKKIENLGYYATNDLLLYDSYNALLLFNGNNKMSGQDIYAMCLEGPPGAGKTEFASTYTKLSNDIFGDVELVEYQCDATTGKTELFEDINISAAIRGDAEHVNIPGKLIEAINKVNSGKRVVLFIDEYDKAREETDAFLLQFLQSGKINSTQHGDLSVKEEYKSHLQVILCKNDMREELSGPLSRRIRINRLDYMSPQIFYKVSHRVLVEDRKDKVSDGLINLVSLMYNKAYDNKDMFNRLPSCSEMLIALEDADRLLKSANAPQHIIYSVLVSNMFKSVDDIETFESSLDRCSNQDDSQLSALVESMKVVSKDKATSEDINSLIADNVFTDESKKLVEKTKEFEKLINDYEKKFADMEKIRKTLIEQELEKIDLESGKLVSSEMNIPNMLNTFNDEAKNVKRGYNVFNLENDGWTEVAQIERRFLSHDFCIRKLLENADDLGLVLYENGILLKSENNQSLVAISCLDKNNIQSFRLFSNEPIISSLYLKDILSFSKTIDNIMEEQPSTISGMITKFSAGYCNVDALVYNDKRISSCDKAMENVYHVVIKQKMGEDTYKEFDKVISELSVTNPEKVKEYSKKLTNSKNK